MSRGILGFLLSLLSLTVLADERILSFHSEITVQQDGRMSVVETIEVRAEGDKIKRGIYRDFPTRYKDQQGRNKIVDFDVSGVVRDGAAEPWHINHMENGVRVYAGQESAYLSPGVYRYRISYETDRQIGFYQLYDELYWNVTGNGWVFPIDKVSARVILPSGVPLDQVQLDGYTGRHLGKEQAFESGLDSDNRIVFVSTRSLSRFEGLSIVVGWPKGFVNEPTGGQRLIYLLRDNHVLLTLLGGLLIILVYYLVTWHRVGKDPETGVVIPLFEPPHDLSPAAVRYISNLGFDHKTFSACIIDMAVKGYLEIHQDGDKDYTLVKQEQACGKNLTRGEMAVARRLFGDADASSEGSCSIQLKNTNHKTISKAVGALRSYLRDEYEKTHFITNLPYTLLGFLISLAVILIAGITMVSDGVPVFPMLFMTIWLSGWTFAVGMLAITRHWFMLAVFGFFEIAAIGTFSVMTSPGFVVFLLGVIALNILFYHLLKAPTLLGQRVIDKVNGFKQYLGVAEQQRLNLLNQPHRTPQLFEQFLPYALALDVDQEWSEQFSTVLASARVNGKEYHPRWYHGSHWDHSRPQGFSSSLGGAFSSAISAAGTAPGSASGGGGGGFSGGGGGGGGGGGW